MPPTILSRAQIIIIFKKLPDLLSYFNTANDKPKQINEFVTSMLI